MQSRIVAAAILASAVSLHGQQRASHSEPEVPIQRLELGGQFIYLGSTTCFYLAGCTRPPAAAFGPALAVNLTRHFALDASFNTTVQTQQPPTTFYEGTIAGGRGTALMVGPRFELRRPKYGLFLFGQAGYQGWSQAPGPLVLTPVPGGLAFTQTPARQTYFAAGYGLGGEYSPTPKIHLRASIAERSVRYTPVSSVTTCAFCQPPSTTWRTSEVFSAGVWTGVGPAVRGRGSLTDQAPTHRFFGPTNLLLISGATLAGITDAVVTHHFITNGEAEGDPIERPFIQNGLGGFIAIGLITETAAIGFMYGLHHMGHHFLERLLPVAVMLGEGRTDYQVVRDTY